MKKLEDNNQIIFKYCSTFDSTKKGNIGPVIDAIMKKQKDLPVGNTKEERKKRRLVRNRVSAQLHRERKKKYIAALLTKGITTALLTTGHTESFKVIEDYSES